MIKTTRLKKKIEVISLSLILIILLSSTLILLNQYINITGFSTYDYENNNTENNDICTVNNCNICDGKVTQLTLKYLGPNANIIVKQKKDHKIVFNQYLNTGEDFSFSGTWKKDTLGTEILIYENNNLNTQIHTSCSQPIGPGLISGDFLVVAGESKNNGPLCPVEDCEDNCGPYCNTPQINLISPQDNSIFNYSNINLTYNIESQYQPNQCTLNLNNTFYSQPFAISNFPNIASFNLSEGTYYWNVTCKINNQNYSSTTWNFTIINSCEDDDEDEICNNNDNCPNTYNPGQEDQNNNGIGDACDTPCTSISITPTHAELSSGTDVTSKVQTSNNIYAYYHFTAGTRYIYLDWENNNIPTNKTINEIDLGLEHRESDMEIKVEWFDGNSWIEVCDPAERSYDYLDHCNLEPYINTPSKANNINLRLKLTITYNCYEKLDWTFLNITYCNNNCNDEDNDGICNNEDNCPNTYNPDQLDVNNNGQGDYCECELINFNDLKTGQKILNISDITVTTINNHQSHPNLAIIFNSSSPTGGDTDLGTPNQAFGGPGIGTGGQSNPGKNDEILKNILIIAENNYDGNSDNLIDNPDDEAQGGYITFDFPEKVDILSLKVLDMDESPAGWAKTYDNSQLTYDTFNTYGQNSLQNIIINSNNATKLKIKLEGSGAIDNINFCRRGCNDFDNDGICDNEDNCNKTYNPSQEDQDNDGIGDVCDNCEINYNPNQEDYDNDTIGNICDNCNETYNPGQEDQNNNGIGDACEECTDQDNDTICDNEDNCNETYNPGQEDQDNDGIGDICDNCNETFNPSQTDYDLDFIGDSCDNCPHTYNPGQEDDNNNSIGNACEYNETPSDNLCCCGLDVEVTPKVIDQGDKVLVTADVTNLQTGLAALPSDLTDLNLTLYKVINGTPTTIAQNVPMNFLSDGLWYYEYLTNDTSGTYIASVTMLTNQTTPFIKEASDTFTIGLKSSGLTVFGVSPDLVNINETTRLAAEIKINGIPVDNTLISNATITITKINGSTQIYNATAINGVIYVDGEFNDSGVYYLDWSLFYQGKQRTSREIVVTQGWDNKLDTIVTTNTELLNLIKENRQHLLDVLTNLESMQDFSDEEIFLITDSVNSMSKVVNYLETGKITNEEAKTQYEEIQNNLNNKLGTKLTGLTIDNTKTTNPLTDWRNILFLILLMLMISIFVVIGLLVKILQNGTVTTFRKPKKIEMLPKRRYEVLLEKLKNRGNIYKSKDDSHIIKIKNK